MVWYSHLFQNFPQFIVIHTVKGFGIVNKAEIDVFLELSCFFDDPTDVGNLLPPKSCLLDKHWSAFSHYKVVFFRIYVNRNVSCALHFVLLLTILRHSYFIVCERVCYFLFFIIVHYTARWQCANILLKISLGISIFIISLTI